MKKQVCQDFSYYTFDGLATCSGMLHFVSSGERNIGFTEDSGGPAICENRRLLARNVGFDPGVLVTAQQVHSSHVAVVTKVEAGKGAMDKRSRIPETDALVTNVADVCLMVLSADCVPVLLYDSQQRVIAAVHAGWRGTAAQIVLKTVQVMVDRFGCRAEQIQAGIGPSIGKCCFEVDGEVADVFRNLFPVRPDIVTEGKTTGKYQVDLWEANRQELVEGGLLPDHIEIAGMCSVCHPDRFFSYRREGKAAGRFGAGIMLC